MSTSLIGLTIDILPNLERAEVLEIDLCELPSLKFVREYEYWRKPKTHVVETYCNDCKTIGKHNVTSYKNGHYSKCHFCGDERSISGLNLSEFDHIQKELKEAGYTDEMSELLFANFLFPV